MTAPADTPLAFTAHDHAGCTRTALAAARDACAAQGLRLTAVRERVLRILLESHRALGAYDILDRLRADGLRAQPPVAYRALDFLVAHGFAHRVERLNAFVACSHAGDDCAPAFMICTGCRKVAEVEAAPLDRALSETARAAGFTLRRAVVEAEGLCPECQARA